NDDWPKSYSGRGAQRIAIAYVGRDRRRKAVIQLDEFASGAAPDQIVVTEAAQCHHFFGHSSAVCGRRDKAVAATTTAPAAAAISPAARLHHRSKDYRAGPADIQRNVAIHTIRAPSREL